MPLRHRGATADEGHSRRSPARAAHLRPTRGPTRGRAVGFNRRSAGDRRRRTAAAGRARAASPAPCPAGPDDAGCAGSPPSLESAPPASDDRDSAGRPGRHTRSCAASGSSKFSATSGASTGIKGLNLPPANECVNRRARRNCSRFPPSKHHPMRVGRYFTLNGNVRRLERSDGARVHPFNRPQRRTQEDIVRHDEIPRGDQLTWLASSVEIPRLSWPKTTQWVQVLILDHLERAPDFFPAPSVRRDVEHVDQSSLQRCHADSPSGVALLGDMTLRR